jgi:glycosyltransferase involved in cell wall biosynthesis
LAVTEVTRSRARSGERAPVGGSTVRAEAVAGNASATTVLVITNTLKGGTGAHIVRLLELLGESHWKPLLLCQGSRDFDPPASVPLIDDRERGWLNRFPLAQWRQLRTVHRLVRMHRPAFVHAFFFWPIIYGRVLKRLGLIPHLVENREDQGFIWSDTDYRILRATATIPDRVICVSEAVREVVLQREGTPEDRTVVIQNGVQLPTEAPSKVELAAARTEFGFGPEHRIVGMVANLDHAVKGASYFVEALPLIVARVPEARFLVLGEGREKAALRARAEELGVGDRVVFAGFRSDVHRLYPIMDVSVLTSLSEGLSITILESMSFGIPLVVTAVGGNPELVRDGESGFLVPPKDVTSFADAVVRVLRDPALASRFGRAGRAVVERDFALDTVAERYAELYRDVLAGGGAHAA